MIFRVWLLILYRRLRNLCPIDGSRLTSIYYLSNGVIGIGAMHCPRAAEHPEIESEHLEIAI